MVSHFHYDPVWWNTQAAYTSEWDALGRRQRAPRSDFQQSGFDLVRPTWSRPAATPTTASSWPRSTTSSRTGTSTREDRDYLRRLIAQGRLELMGGT